jgi:hypothetical protein
MVEACERQQSLAAEGEQNLEMRVLEQRLDLHDEYNTTQLFAIAEIKKFLYTTRPM